jgi:Rps23 Pro-64 3,4-dihydroxylase Tpa1-like proline 4-hydroxylase
MQTFEETDIISYNDVFDNKEYSDIVKHLSGPHWRYGHGSDKKNPNYKNSPPFWIMELNEEKLFTEVLFQKILNLTESKFSLLSVYANGHTYGTKGRPHQDSYDKKGYTFLYYPNSVWDLEWGGKTAFILDEDKYYFKNPKPNCAILFPGTIWHYAEETSRMFNGLRITIAWKLLLED